MKAQQLGGRAGEVSRAGTFKVGPRLDANAACDRGLIESWANQTPASGTVRPHSESRLALCAKPASENGSRMLLHTSRS